MRRNSLGPSSSKYGENGTSMRATIQKQQQPLMETGSKVIKDARDQLQAEDQTEKGRTLDLEWNGISLKLSEQLNRNGSAERREDQSSMYSLESKSLFSRQQSTKKSKVPNEPSLAVSNKNKRLAESFMHKLNLAQNYALTVEEASKEFIKLIHELNRKECEYSDLTRPNKLMRSMEEEQVLHLSPQNRRLRSQISEDLRRVRSFASKYKFPMYRKDIESPSFDVGRSIPKVLSQKSHKKRTDPFKSDLSHLNLCKFDTEPQSRNAEIIDPSDRVPMLFPSLKSRKRQALNDRQRHKLGVNYLKQRGRMRQRSKQKATNQRGKITLVKEIIHRWKIDNRFLKVRGDMEEEPLGETSMKVQKEGKNRTE